MAVGDNVRTVIDETWGQVLRYRGQLCDTRYSKCCGGKTELFSTCWEDIDYPYLQCVDDPWCDCENDEILAQVLNDYDQQTKDFHDWTVRYGADDALISAQATLDGDAFVNGSGDYAGRWVNSGTWAWAPAGVLRPISDFAVSPRVYEE